MAAISALLMATQSDEDQAPQTPICESFDEARQKGELFDHVAWLEFEMVRCVINSSKRLQRTREILSKTTELLAYSHEAIKRSDELLGDGKRHRITD
jgi:hypothetical protein